MSKHIYIIKDEEIAFKLDNKKQVIYFYQYYSKINENSKAVLTNVNKDLALDIEGYLNIDFKDYGVVIQESKTRTINDEEKEQFSNMKFENYFFISLGVIVVMMLISDYWSNTPETLNSTALGWLCLLCVLFAHIVLIGKHQVTKNEINSKLKFNIITKPLPTKDARIEELEARVKELESSKKY